MKIVKVLYDKMLENDFKSFCNIYEKGNSQNLYLFHDTLISTAYLSQELNLNSKKYEEFVNFLLSKCATIQLVALLTYQNDEKSYRYWSDPRIKLAVDGQTILLNAALQGANKKALIRLSSNDFEKVLKLVLQSEHSQLKIDLLDLIPDSEHYIKLVLDTFIQSAKIVSDIKDFDFSPYEYFLKKYSIDAKIFLQSYLSKDEPSTFTKIFSFARTMGRKEDLLLINWMTSLQYKPEWYSRIFQPLSEIRFTKESEEVVNLMYLNLSLNNVLREKKY